MNEYIIFGDYKEACGHRCDFKIFDFIQAEDPATAFIQWKVCLLEEGIENLHDLFEEEVYVMKVDGERQVFNLCSTELLRRCNRR